MFSMLWRKRAKLCTIAAVLFILFIISNKVLYKKALTAGESKQYKLNDKRSMSNDLKSDKRKVEGENKRRDEKLKSLVGKKGQKVELREEDVQEKKEASHKQSCKRQDVVVFIKTHKTGSSTITNILNRFADMNDLKVALPMGDFYRFRWPVPFHWSAVDLWRLDGDTPSILSNHARYNRPTIQLIMQKGAKYITILRNPLDQYESTFHYMEFGKFLQLNHSKNPLADFVENPVPKLYAMREKYRGIPEPMNLVKNPMFFDLGMYPPAYDNMTRVRNEILKLDRDFELVLIMEYFDESLILLKKAFCWTMQDILYVKFNQRQHKPKVKISEKVKQNILYWNKADVMLYDHFNKTLWRKIKDYGPSFWKDVKEFRRLNSKMQSSCAGKAHISEKAFMSNGQILSFRLNPNVPSYDRYFCMKVVRNEVEYVDYFRKKFKPYGSYQNLLEKAGKKKRSTRELIERLQIAANIKFADSVPRAVT